MTGISYADESILISDTTYTIIDSGTSLIVLETKDYDSF